MRKTISKLSRQVQSIPSWFWLGIICLIFAALSLGNMTRWSIWFDEAFSAYMIRFDFVEIMRLTALDVHPPFYYWLLHIWGGIFGSSEIGLRSMSLVWALVAIVGLFILLRRLFSSPNIALVATALFALSPMLVRFSHEARMYTLVLAIVIWGTYCLVRMQAQPKGRWWIAYGLLLVVGMLTHYFVALAWLAHWAWRIYEVRARRQQRFWTKQWIAAHVLGVGIYFFWLPIAIIQFTSVQSGFWIPAVDAYTPVDYLSNALFYQQYGESIGWWAVLLFVAIINCGWLIWRSQKAIRKVNPAGFWLIIFVVLIPPILLFVMSLPPLTSTFIDRYVMYSQLILLSFVGLCLGFIWQTKNSRNKVISATLVIAFSLAAGISNVYYYGNYNKNSSTSIRVKEVMQHIKQQGESGQPVVIATPWIYYEAAFYDSAAHHVYFIDENTKYGMGSLEMLRTSDIGKIKDVKSFVQNHRYVWYMDNVENRDVKPPYSNWKKIKSVEAYDNIDKKVKYRASLFDTQAN